MSTPDSIFFRAPFDTIPHRSRSKGFTSDAVYSDVLCAAAHASFSHGEFAIAAYLDDEAPGEDEEDPEDTDMRDTNFVDDWRQSGRE